MRQRRLVDIRSRGACTVSALTVPSARRLRRVGTERFPVVEAWRKLLIGRLSGVLDASSMFSF